MSHNRAQRRYSRSVLVLSAVYVAILFSVVTYFNHSHPAGLPAYAAAILPALPLLGIFFAMGRYLVEENDEYLRMKVTRQALIATGFAMAVATIWGFLESFDLVNHADAYWAAVMWFVGLGIGSFVNRVTLGDGGC